MVNEFHTLSADCAIFVPSGPGYTGQVSLENQVCTIVGSVPGAATVDGNTYMQLSYEYSFSHLWRVRFISLVDENCTLITKTGV